MSLKPVVTAAAVLLWVVAVVLLPAEEPPVVGRLSFAGWQWAIPEDWQPLSSPSPSLLRWGLDAAVAEGVRVEAIDEPWLRGQSAVRRVALAVLPSAETDADAAMATLILGLETLATEPEIATPTAQVLGGRRWLELHHSWRFAGHRIHQTSWLTIIGTGEERRCLALSTSAGEPAGEAVVTALRALLATAIDDEP